LRKEYGQRQILALTQDITNRIQISLPPRPYRLDQLKRSLEPIINQIIPVCWQMMLHYPPLTFMMNAKEFDPNVHQSRFGDELKVPFYYRHPAIVQKNEQKELIIVLKGVVDVKTD